MVCRMRRLTLGGTPTADAAGAPHARWTRRIKNMTKDLVGALLIVLTVGLMFDNTFAEFYQWTDANGAVHFSDSPTNAPKGKPQIVRRDEVDNSSSLPVRNQSPALKSPKSSTKDENASRNENSVERGQANNFDDSSLVSMWNSMVSCISRSDTASALNYMHPRARQQYKEMFATLKPKLPEIMSTRRNFKLIKAGERKATYELTTSEPGGQYSYEVVFVKDENKWWIYEF